MITNCEANPMDGWWFGEGVQGLLVKKLFPDTATDVYDPVTMEEQRTVAGCREESLHCGLQTYVDGMDEPVSRSYAAMASTTMFSKMGERSPITTITSNEVRDLPTLFSELPGTVEQEIIFIKLS